MEKMMLVKPTIEYKKQAIDYINEFYEYNSQINGVGGLARYLKNETNPYKELPYKKINKERKDIKIINKEGR